MVSQAVPETEIDTEKQKDRQTGAVSGLYEFSSHIVDWVSSLYLLMI